MPEHPREPGTVVVGVLADTHVPHRMSRLPEAVLRIFEGVDLILHAGDVDRIELLHELAALAPLHAVRGNLHFGDLSDGGLDLPVELQLTIAGRRVVVNHGGWPHFVSQAGDWIAERFLGLNADRLNRHIAARLARHVSAGRRDYLRPQPPSLPGLARPNLHLQSGRRLSHPAPGAFGGQALPGTGYGGGRGDCIGGRNKLMIKAGSTILFQGDSITDTKRDRDATQANLSHALGVGYCNHVAAHMLRERPADNLRFYNRGISGDRIVDLYARWRVDAINLKPDVISILVGSERHLARLQGPKWRRTGARCATVYRMPLDYTRQQLPDVQFALCEPFVFQCGEVTEAWMGEMGQRQQIVRRLADEFGARFVPFQSALDEVLKSAPAEYWLADGVHPTTAGHRVLAECWVETVTGTKIGL